MTGRFIECSAAEYHNDPGPVPTLSVSIAKTMNEQSPKHAWLEHPRLGGHRWTPTEEMNGGTIMHSLLLGGGGVQEVDAEDFRTNVAKKAKEEANKAGLVAVTRPKLEGFRVSADRITASLGELGIVLSGEHEQTILWTQYTPGGPVACRSRLDHFIREEALVYDVKMIESAHPDKCSRQIADMGYDIQGVGYTRAVEDACPELVGRVRFVLLFCEKEEPYAVTPMLLDGQFLDLGTRKWERAANTWGACLRANVWPAYAVRGRPLVASPPPWAIARELAQSA